MKRFLTIQLEYDTELNPLRLYSYVIYQNIARLLDEDMPYVKVIRTLDSGRKERTFNDQSKSC